jgi:hypothetical protein
VKVVKKQKTGAFDVIQALQKKPNVDAQVILKTAAGLPKGMLMLIIGKQVDFKDLPLLDNRKGERGTKGNEKIM